MSGINKVTPTTLQGNLSSAKLSGGELVSQAAPIVKIPPSLSQLQKALILRGEVQQQNPDGTTRIKTPRGSIDIKLDTPPSKGQKVDIQIPAGSPPREVIVQSLTPRPPPTHPSGQQSAQQPDHSLSPSVQPAKPAPPAQTQPPPVQTPQPPSSMDEINTFRQTAQQAAEKIATIIRQSLDPAQIGRAEQPQTGLPRPLATGQAIRLTPLPPSFQNPTGLAQLPTAPVTQPSSTALLSLPANPAQQSVFPLPAGTPVPRNGLILPMPLPSQNLSTLPLLGGNAFTLPSPAGQQSRPALLSSVLQAGNALNLPYTGQMPHGHVLTQQSITAPPLVPTSANPSSAGQHILQDARVLSLHFPSMGHQGTSMTIASITQPLSAVPSLQAGQVPAIATGHITAQGNPIVQIMLPPFAGTVPQPFFFALNYPATNLPAGTQIVLQPATQSHNPINVPSHPAFNLAWPSIEDAFDYLLGQMSATQGQSLLNVLPRPAAAGHQFTAAALLFIAAARGGDISGWLGARADHTLRNANAADKKDTLNRLLGDIGRLSGRSSAADPQAPATTQGSGDWRGYTLPLLFGMDLSKIHLWTKPFGDEDGHNDDPNKAAGTRFIVDLSLSRMGRVQLDGLVQPYAKRLDLSLKTEQELGPDMRHKLRGLWHDTLSQIEMSGHIDFQTT